MTNISDLGETHEATIDGSDSNQIDQKKKKNPETRLQSSGDQKFIIIPKN